MPQKAVLFDLDGTLVNTLRDLADSCNQALELSGFETHPLDSYRSFVGNGVNKLIERALPAKCRDSVTLTQTRALFDEIYAQRYCLFSKPYAGINELLLSLRERDWKIAMLSNKPDTFTQKLVQHCFSSLPFSFDVCFGQRERVPKKPDPAAVFEILDLLQISSEQAVFVGDSGVDMQTAQNAGLFKIGVLWGFRSREELLENGADVLVSDPKELLDILINRE